MKKYLLLLALGSISFFASAQPDTVFFENFDTISNLKVTTTGLGGATTRWKDTTNLKVSGTNSYHARVESGIGREVVMRTNMFSTKGQNFLFVFLNFNQIAKINLLNRGLIRISTDGGTTWTQLDNSNVTYLGSSTNWTQLGWFNESSYLASSQGLNDWSSGSDVAAQNSWWKFENFDISSLALGPNGTGYDSVMIEFACQFVGNPGTVFSRPFGEGWYVDNLMITGSTCELFPPTFDFNYVPFPTCFQVQPKNGQTEEFDSTYTIGARVNDSVPNQTANDNRYTGVDTVWVYYRIIDSNGVAGPWQKKPMTQSGSRNDEYVFDTPKIIVGDTVEYYYFAIDKACPNSTRVPDTSTGIFSFKFWPVKAFPQKCGNPFCGAAPGVIRNFPWTEGFEGGEWVPGTGGGSTGTLHRGDFPNEQQGNAYWVLSPNEGQTGYGWSIRSGPTGTNFTGPTSNHTPGGSKYIYAEASQGTFPDRTVLITPCIDLTSSTGCKLFEFYYHFFGDDVGNLRIDIDTGSGNNTGQYWNNYFRIAQQQQTSSSDPWRRAIFDLTPFNGKFIRIRFGSVKLGQLADDRGDMAIDDFRIFDPGGQDAEIIAYDKPLDGSCSYSNSEDVTVVIRNSGCDTLRSVPVAFEVNGPGGTVTRTETASLSLGLGDTTLYTFTNKADLSTIGSYTLKVYTDLNNDIDRSNDTILGDSVFHKTQFSSFPLVEDFNNAGAEGSQTFGNPFFIPTDGLDPNFKWVVGQEMTTTRNTGPRFAYYWDKGGKYIYTEATGSTGSVETYLETERCLDFTGLSNPTLDFYYHTYGGQIEEIRVQSSVSANVWVDVPGSNVSRSQNEELDDWEFKRVDLSSFSNSSVKLRIVGERRSVGSVANMAIDKIMIYDRIAKDAGVELILNPKLSVPANDTLGSAPFIPQVQIRNFGTTNINNVTVDVTVTPRCGPQQGVTRTYSSVANTGTIGAGNSATLNMPNLNLFIPLGDCEVCAYATGVTGDNIAFNDTVCRSIVGNGSFDISFADNFDNCNYDATGFFAQAGLLQWELGTPSFGNIVSPQSSPNAWVTNLDGPYLTNTQENLRTPALDNFDTVIKPTVRFWQNVDMAPDAAGAFETILTTGWESVAGSNSGVVIASNQGQNWYFSSFGSLGLPIFGGEPGFTGSSAGWKLSSFPLNQFNFNPDERRFRFRFQSNPSNNTGNSGWGIDDFELFIPPQNSASPVQGRLISPLPFPRQDQGFSVKIANTGAKLLEDNLVRVIMDPGTPSQWLGPSDSVQAPRFLIEGTDFNHAYTGIWPGTNVTSGTHIMRVETSRPNWKADNRPIDDTLSVEVQVLDEFQFNVTTGDTIYCNDFEAGNGQFPFITLNSVSFQKFEFGDLPNGGFGITDTLTTWELGAPVQFDSAASGSQAWMTRLSQDYDSRDQSSLFTPIFLIDTSANYEISFDHWIDSEKFHDGGTVEVTTDGGITWQVIGEFGNPNWFNTEFVTSLDIIKPGWTDTTNGWVPVSNTITFDSTYQAVFRFRFESDFTIERAGWAIDNFCLKTTENFANAVVGTEEVKKVQELIVGDLSPNPAQFQSFLPIYAPNTEEATITVFDIAGRPVQSFPLLVRSGSNEYPISIDTWADGIYLVKIEIAGKTHTRKLIIGN